MRRLYKFPLDDKEQYVLIEIEASDGGGVVRAARPSDEAINATANFSDTLSKIQPLFLPLVQILNQIYTPKDNIHIAFGIKFTSDGEILITAGQNEANFIVTIHRTS
jgi:hypothetical protein